MAERRREPERFVEGKGMGSPATMRFDAKGTCERRERDMVKVRVTDDCKCMLLQSSPRYSGKPGWVGGLKKHKR